MFTIAPASPADLPAAAAALASAFAHGTTIGSLVNGANRESRLAGLFRALMHAGAFHAGRVDLARRDSDGVLRSGSRPLSPATDRSNRTGTWRRSVSAP